jgi:hypothetical protein
MTSKERELEKEKLYQERRLIERREDELEMEREEQERRRAIGPSPEDDSYGYGMEDDEFDQDGVYGSSMSGSSYDSSSFGTESNGQIDEIAYGDYDSEEEYFQQYHHYNPYQMPFNNSKQQTHK